MLKEKNGQKHKGKDCLLQMVLITCLTAVNTVLGILCISGIKNEFIRGHFVLISLLYGGILILAWGVFLYLLYKGKAVAKNSVYIIAVFIFCALLIWLILQRTGFFEVFGDAERLQQYLKTTGAWMPMLYILLQFLQVVILPIPSIVSTMAGVSLFGAFWTTVYSFLGIMSGSVFAFLIAKKWGKGVVAWMTGKETLNKWQKKVRGKDTFLLTMMFFLPFFPDDILCFLAGLSSMRAMYFIVVIGFARLLGIACTCYSVNLIPITTWWGILLWLGIFAIGLFACFFVNKHADILPKKLKFLAKRRH